MPLQREMMSSATQLVEAQFLSSIQARVVGAGRTLATPITGGTDPGQSRLACREGVDFAGTWSAQRSSAIADCC